MNIVAVEALPIRLSAETSYLGQPPQDSIPGSYFTRANWRSLYSADFETLLIRIETDEGLIGWGESLAPVGPRIPAAIVRDLLEPVLIGEDPTRVRPLWHRLSGLMRERGHLTGHQADALAGVDIALWDLWGKIADQPISALLGGAFRGSMPYYVSGLPRSDDNGRVELMKTWMDQGIRHVKLHLGNGVESDLMTFDRIAALNPDLKIAIDAHWAYSTSEALRLGRQLDRRGAWFYEAPLVPEDIEGTRELAAQLCTPVAIGEALRNRFEFAQWLRSRAMDIAQPDVGRTGITEAIAISEIASTNHVPTALHHSTGLGVSIAAGLHVSAAIAEMFAFEFQPDTYEVANRILSSPLERNGVGLIVPNGPGLGVEIDESAVRSATIGGL
jgi:D-galactarolactone cycloisomerase